MTLSNNIDVFQFHSVDIPNILISYKGPFDKYIIAKLGKKLKMLADDNQQISKKIFQIFIELAQNVGSYSSERSSLSESGDTGVGSLIIAQDADNYIFGTGNVIRNQDLTVLSKKCAIINSLDRMELRAYKREQRNILPGTNGNAHIGLVMVSLITRKPIDAKFTPLDENYAYFSVTVKINKNAIDDTD